ncbi:MAG: FHA domain-containing protein [Sedimentisphaerales bacterium]|nr:FHA domain-containing protein [Sedimentisphaerales bacterium]
MKQNICSSCGNVFEGERSRFCDQCGFELTQVNSAEISKKPETQTDCPTQENISSLSQEQKESIYLEKVKEARSDGKVPVCEMEELENLRECLGISKSQATELSEKAIESLLPIQKDDFDKKTRTGTTQGLSLSINTNQFYMQGFRGVIDIKLENLSDDYFEIVKVELSSDLLAHAQRWSCSLASCQNVRKRFSVKLADAGIECVQFRISLKKANKIYAFWADTDLPIFEHTKDLRNISIQAHKLIDFGSVSDNAKNMGNCIKNQVDNFLKLDKIQTANDFMSECKRLPANFKILNLTFDPERSEQLTNSMTIVKASEKSKRIVNPDRGSLTDSASLQIQSKDMPANIVLFAKSEISFGKNRRNDIVTRILPRSESNDNQSNQMGRDHCKLELTENGVFVKDNKSVNGTLLDGKEVGTNGMEIKAESKELELAGVLKMSIGYVGSRYQFDNNAYEKLFNSSLGLLWNAASNCSLNSITLKRLNNLGADDNNGLESYCNIYRIATIGSKPHCAISFADKGLEPIHAAILYLGNRFYLENLSDLTDVVINDTTLSKNEIIPLCFGDRIRIARLDMKFQQKSQLYIDS